MQLSKDEIVKKLVEILINQDEKYKSLESNVTDNMSLTTDLGLNSVGMLYLVIVIEETFGIHFEDIGIDDFKTFGDMVSYIQENQK